MSISVLFCRYPEQSITVLANQASIIVSSLFKMALMLLFVAQISSSQQKILMNNQGDVIQLKPGENPSDAIQRYRQSSVDQALVACQGSSIVGYATDKFPPDTVIHVHHSDVVASWFVSPGSGTIDTILWQAGPEVGAISRTVYMRIDHSTIGPGTGPGFGYPSPPTAWGKYFSFFDQDQGIAPFREMATDTHWISTVTGTTPSFPPTTNEIWGFSGFPATMIPNALNKVSTSDLGFLATVNPNESFLVSFRVNAPFGHTTDGPTDFSASRTNVPSPSRAWVFYEHDSTGPATPRGWQAIGRVNMNIWVAMTLNSFGTITIQKTIDINGNGIKEPADGIALPAGVSAKFMVKKNGIPYDSAILGNGVTSYTLCVFDTGAYTVEETGIPSGWIQTSGGIHTTIVNSGGVIADTARYLNFKLVSVSGMKFYDANRNQVRDVNEAGLGGWVINVSGAGGGSATTDGSGNYVRTGIRPGTHAISEVLRPQWVQTAPPTGVHTFNATSGQILTGRDFGNYDSSAISRSISGRKFADVNNNGVKDPTDIGLANWEILLFQAGSSTPMATTLTNSTGHYIFAGLAPGTYILRETPQPHWTQTYPASSFYTEVMDAAGTPISDRDFGNYRLVTSDTARTIITTEVIGGRPDSVELKAFEFHIPGSAAANKSGSAVATTDPLPVGTLVYSWDSAVVYTVTQPKYFYWFDLAAGFKYGHPCLYVFVDQATAAVESLSTQWWPVIKLPSQPPLEQWNSWDGRVNSPDLIHGNYGGPSQSLAHYRSTPAKSSARPSISSAQTLTGRCAILIAGRADSVSEEAVWQHDLDSVREALTGGVPPAVESPNVLMQNNATVDSLLSKLHRASTCDTMYLFLVGHGDTSPEGGIVMNKGGYPHREALRYSDLSNFLFDSLNLKRLNILIDASHAGRAIAEFMHMKKPVVNLVTSTDASSAAGWGLPTDTHSVYTNRWRIAERTTQPPLAIPPNWRRLNDSVRAHNNVIRLQQNSKDTTNAPRFDPTPSGLIFPDVAVGNRDTQNIYISNTGFIPLQIDSIVVSNSQFEIVGPDVATILRNNTKTFPLLFEPGSAGIKSATVTFYHSGEISPDSLPASGNAVVPTETTKYRTFSQESLAVKGIKPKADSSKFCASFTNFGGTVNGIDVKFNMVVRITGSDSFPNPPVTTDGGKTWQFTGTIIPHNAEVEICGIGNKGRLVKVAKYYWKQGIILLGPQTGFTIPDQQLLLRMPNGGNFRDTVFRASFLPIGGMVIGVPSPLDLSKGWIRLAKSTNVKTYFRDKSSIQNGPPRPFDTLTISPYRPFAKQQKNLSPRKYSNHLAGELAALLLSIEASASEKTQVGLGELIYDDSTSNPLNRLMIKEVADSANRALTHRSGPPTLYVYLDSTISRINRAFSGPMDTSSFGTGLKVKGVRSPDSIQYVRSSTIPPARSHPVAQWTGMPEEFTLYQNYPNPFNPTTTIEFDLPEPAIVTLKIYNVLGQEVATLLDHQDLDDGTQQVEFAANDVASGVYFYRLTVDGILDEDGEIVGQSYVTVKKMLLLR